MPATPFSSNDLQIFAPVDQARRCIDIWLKEEGRDLRACDKKRLAGLVARYFYYEEDLNDQLMLSFLRHYAGNRAVDLEDPAAVREEIHALLDKTTFRREKTDLAYRILVTVTSVLLFMAVCFTVNEIIHLPMTAGQQNDLKMCVQKIVSARPDMAAATVWSKVKKPLGVKSYQDITFWQYDEAMAQLDLLVVP